MTFIRVKRRAHGQSVKEYAYLVRNTWHKRIRSPRQSVSKYLGRIHTCERHEEPDFFTFHNITDCESYCSKRGLHRILGDLIEWELRRHGTPEGIRYDRTRRTITHDGKECVLRINDGFLCGYTIRRILNFSSDEDDEREIGIAIAERFTEAGIAIPKEVFIGIFEKLAGTVH